MDGHDVDIVKVLSQTFIPRRFAEDKDATPEPYCERISGFALCDLLYSSFGT